MKNVINIFVSLVFLISFIGINIHKHYSGGKLYSTAIFQEAESCCADMGHCEMANMQKTSKHNHDIDCSCKDETETLKISDLFVSERFSFSSEKITKLYFFPILHLQETNVYATIYSKINSTNSPPIPQTDSQSVFGVFII